MDSESVSSIEDEKIEEEEEETEENPVPLDEHVANTIFCIVHDQKTLKETQDANKSVLKSIKELKSRIAKRKRELTSLMDRGAISEVEVGNSIYMINRNTKVVHDNYAIGYIKSEKEAQAYLERATRPNHRLVVKRLKKSTVPVE